jgi:hypothetical protein
VKIYFGKYAQTRYRFGRPLENTKTSIYITGSPDMGKSTLLGNLAEQFVAADEGVLLMDIKGDLARAVASRTKHPERVIYVEMGEIGEDEPRMWTMNPFDGHRDSRARREQIATSVLESFERMGLAQLGLMANIRSTLEHAIDVATTLDDPTYLDLLLIIVSQNYRQHLLATRKHIHPITRQHWLDLDNHKITPTNARRTETNTARNRLERLLASTAFNLPAGWYHSTIRLREWLDEGRFVIVNLGQNVQRETGVELGNLLMAQIMAETFLRKEETKARTWRLVIDEFHLFVGRPFADIITGGRSYNVFPVVAHQDRSQLRSDDGVKRGESNPLLSAVGHAGISLHLAGSREDRVALASLFGAEVVDQFFALDAYSAIINVRSRLLDNARHETLVLQNWWGKPVEGQLEELRARFATHPYTVPRSELVEHNRRRYWDYLDGGAVRDTRNTNVPPKRKPKTETVPPSQIPSQPEPRQAGEPGTAVVPPPSPARPGTARPARALDQRDAPGSVVPRPPRKQPSPQK